MMTQGTLVDATIIEAPSSTRNKEQQRDPEMHQTKKGNQWHFGMKAHIGVDNQWHFGMKAHISVDAKSGLTHSLVTTRPTSMTSISWVICFMERSNLSQPMPATKERHSARSWPRWMWTG
ncbi:putative transposase [Klebsiella quasipneumoniae]|nr:putative transposase [Klebsiella quasipneumoniae]